MIDQKLTEPRRRALQSVAATGQLKQRNYETKEGEKRTSIELQVDEIGPSLKYATAQVTRTGQRQQAAESWSAPAPDFWNVPPSDETPF